MKAISVAAWMCCQLMAATAVADLAIVEVAPGIYRGPAPETAADYRQLQSLGIRTVLDLRTFRRRRMNQEARCVRAHGMDYQRISTPFRPQRNNNASRAAATLADARRRPMYVHCELGRDRVGLIVALYRVRYQGWSRSAAYAEMKMLRFNSDFRAMERYFWECAK